MSVSIPLGRKEREHASVDNWESSCRKPRRRQCCRVWVDKISQLDGAQTRNTRVVVSPLHDAIFTGRPSTVTIFNSTTTSTPSASTTTKKVEVRNLRCGHGGVGGWRKLGAQTRWGTGGAGIAVPRLNYIMLLAPHEAFQMFVLDIAISGPKFYIKSCTFHFHVYRLSILRFHNFKHTQSCCGIGGRCSGCCS